MNLFIFTILITLASAQVRWYNTDDCVNHYDIKDLSSDRTIKNVCQLTTKMSYTQAQSACNAKGMDLFFSLDTNLVLNSFDQYIQNTYSVNSETRETLWGTDWSSTNGLWINGIKLANGSWTAQLNGKQVPFDPAGFWNMGSSFNSTNLPGNCKLAKMIQGSMQIVNSDCTKLFYPICEYNVTTIFPQPWPYPYPYPYTYYPYGAWRCGSNSDSPNNAKSERHFNLNACKSIDTIYDDCGNIIKGICELNSAPVTNDKAHEACDDVGMDLFVSETMQIHEEFMRFIRKKFSKSSCGNVWGTTCGLWVGGRRMSKRPNDYARVRDSYLVQMNFQNSSMGVSVELPFVPAPAGNTGNCVALKNQNGFVYMDHLCTSTFAPICEFDLRVFY